MATIQEALRELRAQRTIKENKKINTEKKTLDEDVNTEKDNPELAENCEDGNCNTVNECDQALQEDAVLLVDQDGDIEKPDFNLQKFYSESCNKENITEAEEDAEATEEEVFEQPEDTEGDETQADEHQEDITNEFTVGAILSKFQDKDENAIVKVAPIEFEGQTYNINLDVNEDEEGNLTLTGVLTPVEAVEESLNEKVDPDKKVTPENIAKLEEFNNVKKK